MFGFPLLVGSDKSHARVDPIKQRRPTTVTRRHVAAFAVAFIALACAGGPPSEADGRTALAKAIDEGKTTRLNITEFKKTDGQSGEIRGVQVYELEFTAKAEFVVDATYEFDGFQPRITGIKLFDYATNQGSMSEFLLAGLGRARANKGDVVEMKGSILFQQKESGWVGKPLMKATIVRKKD